MMKRQMLLDPIALEQVRELRRKQLCISDIKIGDNLTAENKKKLTSLIVEFADIFSKDLSTIGKLQIFEAEVFWPPGKPPIYQYPYKTNI